MNATSTVQRLVWKEYRALRQLWTMCGLGGTFLMLVILAIGESSKNSQGYSAAFWAFTVWVPPVYVLAALATMFAGEREEGTFVWLTALSPRLPSVFFSRIFFVLFTGIGLQAWYALVALVLSQFDDRVGPVVDAEETLRIISFLMVEAITYGLFWSLQTNRPLNAILYAAIMIILVNAGAATLVDYLGGRFSIRPDDAADYALSFWGWVRGIIVLMVMTANWFLASEWLLGNPWDWEWVAHWWSRRRVKAVAGTSAATVPAVLPADAVEPWRRSWQRLRWLEWQSLKSFVWLVLAMAVASCATILIRFDRQPPTFGFSFLICWLAILFTGLLAWHGEQAQQRFRALVRLGVAPLALWANKLACWTLAAIAAVTVIGGATALFWIALSLATPDNTYLHMNKAIRHSMAMSGWWDTVPLFVMACLTVFVTSFVSGHLFRRTVIAFGLALIGSCLVTAWFVICGQYGFPVLFFFVPIPLWLLWISVSTLPAWWTEQTSWRTSSRRATALVVQTLAPAVLLASAAGYRVWEVPTVPAVDPTVSRDVFSSINAMRVGNVVGVQQAWSQLTLLLQKPLAIPGDIQIPADKDAEFYRQPQYLIDWGANEAAARRSLVNANRETIDAIAKEVLSVQAILMDKPKLDGGQWSHLYGPLVLYAAQLALEDGDQDASLRYLQAAVRLTGMNLRFHLQAASPSLGFFNEVLRWAQHPAQTEESLRHGLQLCATELRFWQPQPEELYLYRQQELDHAKDVYWPWERARERKLVDVAYSNRLSYLMGCQQNRLRPGQATTVRRILPWWMQREVGDPALQAWQYILPENRFHTDQFQLAVYGLEHAPTLIWFHVENQYRALLARMAVVGHRRLHGSLPLSLHDVEPFFGGNAPVMHDVWTGSHFGYAPSGFPLKEPQFSEKSVFRQPLLWTAESVRYSLEIRGNEIYRWTDAWGFMGNAVIRGGDVADTGWIFPIPPANPRPETTTEPEAKPEPEPKPGPETKPASDTKPEPEVKPEPEAKPDAE